MKPSQHVAHVFLYEPLRQKLDELNPELGDSRPQIIKRLVEEYSSKSKDFPFASFENLMADPSPSQIVGIPYSGKSFTLDKFLKEAQERKNPFLLFNSANAEHCWIPKTLSFYDAASLRWLERPSQYRVQFEQDLDLRRSAVRELSKTLLRLESDVRLKKFIIVIEEGHDYAHIESFLTVLRRLRKSTRKLIVLSTEANLFGMCKAYRPLPRDEPRT